VVCVCVVCVVCFWSMFCGFWIWLKHLPDALQEQQQQQQQQASTPRTSSCAHASPFGFETGMDTPNYAT